MAFYANARDKLRQELGNMRQWPQLVYFSTATEPFLTIAAILNVQHEIMALLLEAGIRLLISTKGVVPDRFIELFAAHPGRVSVQVGISTLNEEARALIEPRTASINRRQSNLERLIGAGVATEARLDPMIPSLTDTDENWQALMPALARSGVREAVASFLFQRWKVELPASLTCGDWSVRAMRQLYTHKVTDYCGGGTIWLPPTDYRRERFASLRAFASRHGIAIKLCECKNKDLPEASCCHPLPPPDASDGKQLSLF